MLKKIEDLDCYEVLNVPIDASLRDIEKAYLLAIATYHEDSLASYGVLMDEERSVILNKVEEAFQTLRDAEKREAYDAQVRGRHPEFSPKASFRQSTERLLIEDAAEKSGLWTKIKSAVSPVRSRRKDDGNPDEFYHYGDFLKKVRERRGLCLEEIAEKCGVDPLRLRSLEEEIPGSGSNGKKTLELLRCYAKCLGLDAGNGRNNPGFPRFR